ncbi:MAG: family 20 glycosylhydrolase [Tannerellaceae bacterium]|jgi:hexosaminidase|nr:family 20 glycosylhydrolase [Tannerellaceae bacterium]
MRNPFIVCALCALVVLSSCHCGTAEEKVYNQGINIIPAPLSLVNNEGVFTVNKNTTFYASSPEGRTVAEFFAARLNLSTGYRLGVSGKGADAGNTIALITDPSADVGDEGYTLDVAPHNVAVRARTAQGLFYGMQTFMQLLPAEVESPTPVKGVRWTAPAVAVRDEPRFAYRGVMLDASRHFIPVDNIKKQLDVFALFKINRMHWHLTDDQGWRIEIRQYPRLTEAGSKSPNSEGFYTQEEVREIVAYAAERFITVIPEIELPGHELAAISAYPELSCKGEPVSIRSVWGVEDVVLCAGKESVFEFLENVIGEVTALFPSEYFHIGGDECPKTSWKECPLCRERIRSEGIAADAHHSAEERLQSYFVQRIEKILARYGRKMTGWDEILEGGLAPTATVMSWRGEQGGIAAANMDHDVIMTPGSGGMYIDAYQGDARIEPVTIGGYTPLEKTYAYNPIPDTLAATGKGGFIRGVQANLWSEYMYTTDLMEYRAYPRVLALSEIAWSALDRKDYKDFERRVDNALVRLDGHSVNYHIPQPEQPGGSCNFVAFTDKATLEFKTTRPVTMVYTTDGSEPSPGSAVYSSPIEYTRSGTLKIRSVLPSGRMSVTRVITVEKQEPSPAARPSPEGLTPGLQLKVAYGEYRDVASLKAAGEWKDVAPLADLRGITRVEPANDAMRDVKQYAAVASGYVDIPEDGVYYFSSDNEEVWIDGRLLIDNGGEVKRFSRHDRSVALDRGLHELKVVFLGHIIGGWPSNWNNGSVQVRRSDADRFARLTPGMLFH